MAKSKEIPFLSDSEVDELVKTPPKRAIKKPKNIPEVETIEPPSEVYEIPEKPKPVKKPVKKMQEKIVKDIKKIEPEKPTTIELPIKTPDIEYVLRTTTKFDLNWYYMKEKLVGFRRWVLSPYRLYENWFNDTFNKPKQVIKINEGIEYDTLQDLYEELPDSENEWTIINRTKEKEIHASVDKMIAERRLNKIVGDNPYER